MTITQKWWTHICKPTTTAFISLSYGKNESVLVIKHLIGIDIERKSRPREQTRIRETSSLLSVDRRLEERIEYHSLVLVLVFSCLFGVSVIGRFSAEATE